MISISVGLLGGVETAAASVGKKGEDGPAFADTLEQAAASGRAKVVAAGTQRPVKIDRGAGQARKASRSAQSDGGVKQGGLAAAKDVAGAKGAVAGKKIADLVDVVEEQVAGGLGDGKGLQAPVAGAGGAVASAQTGTGGVVGAGKDGAGTAIEVAGLSEEVTVLSKGALQGGVQGAAENSRDGAGRTFGSSAGTQKQAPVGFGHGAEGAIGGSIRPDLKGATDVAIAANPGGNLASAVVPVVASNGVESIGKGLIKAVDGGVSGTREVGVASVESDAVAFVPGQSLKLEGSGYAARSTQVEGVSLPKTISQTRQVVVGEAAGGDVPEIAQVADGVKGSADGVAVPAGQGTVAIGGLESSVGQAVAPKTAADNLAGDSEFSTTSVPVKGVTASPIGSVQVGSPVAVTSGVIHAGLVSVTPVSTTGEIGTEEVDGRLSSGTVSMEPIPVAAKNDSVGAVVPLPVTSRVQAGGAASQSPQAAVADASGVAALQAETAPNRVETSKSVPGEDGSKTAVKSAGRHGETARARGTSAASTGGDSMVAEASAPGVAAPAFVAPTAVAPGAVTASVVPTPVAAPVPQVIAMDVAANETVGGLAPVSGPSGTAASGLKASGPTVSVEPGKNETLVGTAPDAIASRVEGLKVAQGSAGQTAVVSAEQALPNAALTEAGQGIEGRSSGSIPVDTTVAVGEAGVAGSDAVAIAPPKVGQERKAVGGAASVGGRERKGVAGESKTADVATSAGPVEAGRTVAVATSSDVAVASVKPAAAEHRAPGSEAAPVSAAPVSAAPVGMVDGAAVQAHVASTMPVNAAPAASASGSGATSLGAAGGAHAGSVGGSAGDSLVSPMAHTTLQATPTVLEVGVPGGTHGWLKIRAEIGEGGAVTASMSASSHAGQDALRRDLPAMNAFLESEHVPVSVQVVHGTGSSWADKDGAMTQGGAGVGAGLGQSGGQDGSAREAGGGMLADAGGRQQGGNASSQGGAVSDSAGRSGVAGRNVVEGEAAWSPAPGYGSGVRANGGSWLNVVA